MLRCRLCDIFIGSTDFCAGIGNCEQGEAQARDREDLEAPLPPEFTRLFPRKMTEEAVEP